ncbi:MAG: hypothetical protein NXI20_12795 [bacterium]|nr:hypothetical protein [bacterium]
MGNSKINKSQLALEFISVVFAVLLALLLNGWRQSAKTDQLVDRVLVTISQEVETNLQLVKASNTYRESLVNQLKNNQHLVYAIPLNDFPIDHQNDDLLKKLMIENLIFQNGVNPDNVEIKRSGEQRVLIIDKDILHIEEKNDSLFFFGQSNIQLRNAEITNNSWGIAQATGAIVEMKYELVEELAKLNQLQVLYSETSNIALKTLYSGESGILSIMEDLIWIERDMLESYLKIQEIMQDKE